MFCLNREKFNKQMFHAYEQINPQRRPTDFRCTTTTASWRQLGDNPCEMSWKGSGRKFNSAQPIKLTMKNGESKNLSQML